MKIVKSTYILSFRPDLREIKRTRYRRNANKVKINRLAVYITIALFQVSGITYSFYL
jgi:hypothetical protein